MNSNRGEALTLVLIALAALGLGTVAATWKPLDAFRKAPPTADLTKLQGELAQAQAAAESARKEKDAAVAAERAKLEAQIRSAQSDNAGTQAALGLVPAAHKVAEVQLAERMAKSVDFKLGIAIGSLPDTQRAVVTQWIADALAGKQAEFDAQMAKQLAEFNVLRGERDQLKAAIPTLEKRAETAEEKAKAVQGEVTAKTNVVKEIADTLDAEKRKSGSLGTALSSARNVVLWIVGVWAFFSFIVPGLVKHMGEGSGLKSFLRNVSGYVTSPLLFNDAKSKISALKTAPPFSK